MIKKVVKDVISTLEAIADPVRKSKAEILYPTSMTILGIWNTKLNDIAKELKSDTKKWVIQDVIQLAKELVDTNIYECRFIAYKLICRNSKVLARMTVDDMESLRRGLDNWESVDCFAMQIAGILWSDGVITDKMVIAWAKSENLWERRLALAATVGLNMKTNGLMASPKKTIMVCNLLINDKADLVIKALSWAIRELAEVDKAAAKEYFKENQFKFPARVRREVKAKLESGKKK